MQVTATQHDTVMVVEDEAAISDVIASALKDQGYRVLIARDGQVALQMVQRSLHDAIVLDLSLPNVDDWHRPGQDSLALAQSR